MLYKNGFKEYFLSQIKSLLYLWIFWGIYCVYSFYMLGSDASFTIPFLGSDMSYTTYLLCLGFFVTLFSLVFDFLFAFFLSFAKPEKKCEALRTELSKVRKIICEGPAAQRKGINQIGGWLVLSEDALEFYRYNSNFVGNNLVFLLDDIVSAERKRKFLIIQTKTETFKFFVHKAPLWKNSITQIL